MKKILSLILAVFILLLSIIPITHAIQNDNYKFLDGWQPRWIDYPYAMNITTEKGTLSLSGSIYAQYNPMVINYLHYDTPLKWESWYRWLSWWSGIIFVESKKLKPWINKILYTDYDGLYKEYITTDDSSPFWINIYCWENWKCNINPYVWLSYNFPDEYYITEFLRWKIINNENMTLVKDYVIDINSSPDFILYSSIENYNFYNEKTRQDESRIRLSVDVETEPWSGKFRKVTDTTRITAFFPDKIQKYDSLNDVSFELNFFDYTKAYSVWNELLKDDINKIWSFINWDVWNNYEKYSYIFQDYYSSMKNNVYAYLLNLWLIDVLPGKEDLDNAWLGGNEYVKPSNQSEYLTCEWLQDLWCHTKNFWTAISLWLQWLAKWFVNWIKIIFDQIAKFFDWIIDWIYVSLWKEPPKDEEWWFIRDIVNNTIVKWHLVLWTGQWLVCDAKFNYSFTDSKKNYIAEEYKKYVPDDSFVYTFFWLFKFINPLPPTNWQEVCTYMGMKPVNYRENSWVDIILVIMFCGMIIGLFYRNYN